MKINFYIICASLFFFFITPSLCPAADESTTLGALLPLWSILPFAGMLLSIALIPLLAPRFWSHHFKKVSLAWALVFAVPFLFFFRTAALYEIMHIVLVDYIPFILMLWALFTVSGGIYIKGTLKGTPGVNTTILFAGTVLASVIGTTGASMLLIRPLLRSNAWRLHKTHTVIFLIFLVGNIGGSLTPLGDPPLFLGFLHGVPFFWTMHILPETALAGFVLLLIYFILDSFYFKKENTPMSSDGESEPLKIEGTYNLIFLAGIIAAVLFSGIARLGEVGIFGIHQSIASLIKDVLMITMGILSLVFTKRKIREDNDFSWAPIEEVAFLFAGIFITIIPALTILKAGEQGALAWLLRSVQTPAHYFWATGLLSSFLDNAPTYLIFFNSALGEFYPNTPEKQAVAALITERIPFLSAISAGAVFMGAVTYIGNAPNFMVKSIAEEAGVRMPGFFGYMFKYSIPILMVLFIIITFIFYE